VPATFRATTDSRPNPTPPPTVSTPQRMNPASLLQSRSSLGGGGTPICLDFPGSALTPSFPVSGLATPRHPAFVTNKPDLVGFPWISFDPNFPVSGLATPRHPALATNNRDLVGLTWISLDQLGFRAFRSLLQPFTTHLVADNPDQLGFPWISLGSGRGQAAIPDSLSLNVARRCLTSFASPGEISAAHNGVLSPDSAPKTPEVPRQPVEDSRVTISRAAGSRLQDPHRRFHPSSPP